MHTACHNVGWFGATFLVITEIIKKQTQGGALSTAHTGQDRMEKYHPTPSAMTCNQSDSAVGGTIVVTIYVLK